ncbi:MAG: DUF4258 domain-containing protein [Chloroflexi bacterium]|nr:DUF4258 domain-containing protein [Chloroflexota bacterium]
MNVRLHPHARERLAERGASESEVLATVQTGERFPVRFGRTGFRRNFPLNAEWRGRRYATKQVEVYAVDAVDEGGWLIITVIVRYY